jgi:hypothetical protein
MMTLFHENMTLLLAKTPVSVPEWREYAFSLPGIGGLLHSYSGGSGKSWADDRVLI